MKVISPAPISTSMTPESVLPLAWSLWFKDVSDYFKNSCQLTRGDGLLEYALNGTMVHIHIEGLNQDNQLKLPYTVLKSKIIICYVDENPLQIKLNAGDKYITLPVASNILIDEQYIGKIG